RRSPGCCAWLNRLPLLVKGTELAGIRLRHNRMPHRPDPQQGRVGLGRSRRHPDDRGPMTDPIDGLAEAEVQDRVRRGEDNEVPRAASRTVWQIVRSNVFTPFNALLGGLLVVILLVGAPQDALFGGVLIANAAIGIFQELRA